MLASSMGVSDPRETVRLLLKAVNMIAVRMGVQHLEDAGGRFYCPILSLVPSTWVCASHHRDCPPSHKHCVFQNDNLHRSCQLKNQTNAPFQDAVLLGHKSQLQGHLVQTGILLGGGGESPEPVWLNGKHTGR